MGAWGAAPSEGAQSRAAAPWHRKESTEGVRALDQDTSWAPSFRGVLEHIHLGEVRGLQDVLVGLPVPTGLRLPWRTLLVRRRETPLHTTAAV